MKPWFEVPREERKWELSIRQPDFVTAEHVGTAKDEMTKKKRLAVKKVPAGTFRGTEKNPTSGSSPRYTAEGVSYG